VTRRGAAQQSLGAGETAKHSISIPGAVLIETDFMREAKLRQDVRKYMVCAKVLPSTGLGLELVFPQEPE
jgi:hypothetical protein